MLRNIKNYGSILKNKNLLKVNRSLVLIAASLALIAPVFAETLSASAQSGATITQAAQFTDPNPQPDDGFGNTVATSSNGQIAVIGSPSSTDSNGDLQAGAAYVFENSNGNWSEVAQLTPTIPLQNYRFGYSVAISPDGTNIVVGASYANAGESGDAYLFTEPITGWGTPGSTPINITPTVELSGASSGAASGSQFGYSVAISGDNSTVVVGADFQPVGVNTNQGEAYVFTEPGGGWNASPPMVSANSELIASDGIGYDFLGNSVSTNSNGSSIVVGAYGSGTGSVHSGAAYIFNEPSGGWGSSASPQTVTQASKLMSTDGAPNDSFGKSVSMSSDGSAVAIGAPLQSVGGNQTGAAYLFNLSGSTWSQTSELDTSDGVANDYVGYSINLSDDGSTVIVGAPNHTDTDSNNNSYTYAGSVYEFNNSSGSWIQTSELQPSNPDQGLFFGESVSLVDGSSTAFVGAPNFGVPQGQIDTIKSNVSEASNDGTTNSTGTAYAFNLPNPASPIINSAPSSVSAGSTITLSGHNLKGATVTLNNVSLKVTTTKTTIKAKIPLNALTGNLTVTNNIGSTTLQNQLVVLMPNITSLSETSGKIGSKVTITGTGFSAVTQVTFYNNVSAKITSNNGTVLKVVVPKGATTGPITITAPQGMATEEFTVTN